MRGRSGGGSDEAVFVDCWDGGVVLRQEGKEKGCGSRRKGVEVVKVKGPEEEEDQRWEEQGRW